MKKQLNLLLNQLNDKENNQQELAYKALGIIEDILAENPFDIDILNLRMRLNANILEQSAAIIQDANFIIENDAFGEDKLIGYNWLFWVYNDLLSMPEKAIEVIENQLVEIQVLFNENYKKDELEGKLLNQLAQLKFDNNQEEVAIKIWLKSFAANPFLTHRNSFVGYLCLENNDLKNAETFLLKNWHLELMGYNDFEKVKIAKKLKALFENNQLSNHPNLIGLYYNYLRNETEAFGLIKPLDFYDKHLPELEKWGIKYPNCSLIWVAIGNCYFLDTKNYDKAFTAYKTMLKGDEPYTYSIIKRVYQSAKKTKQNLLEITLPLKGNAGEMYEMLTNLNSFAKKAKKKKEKKKYINTAVEFGEQGYNMYKDYLLNGKGNPENNEPYKFAMLCNNYANALCRYAKKNLTKKEQLKVYNYAGDIHMEGFNMSPFIVNIENASQDYFKGKNYNKSIETSLQVLDLYKNELDVFDIQFHYWQIVSSNIKLGNSENAEKYYLKSKDMVLKVGKEVEAGNHFIFTSKLFYRYVVEKKKIYKKSIPEIEWFIKEEIALKNHPKEHYLMHLFLGICYKETDQKEKAMPLLKSCFENLYDEEYLEGYYSLKALEAKEILLLLGGIQEKKKKKWWFF